MACAVCSDTPEGLQWLGMTDRPPLWLLYCVTLVGISANTLIGPAIPDILDHFGQPDTAAGWLVASGPVAAVFLAPITGVLADRHGRKRVLVPALGLYSLGGLIAALSGSFWVLIVGRLVQGFGAAAPVGLVVTIIGDHWDGAERGRHIARNAAVLTVAIAVYPALGGGLTELGGWRWSFAPQMSGFVVAALLLRYLTDVRPNPDAELRTQLRSVRAVLRTPGVTNVMVIGFVIFVLIFGLFVSLFPVFLENEFGLGAGQRGLMLVVPALTSTVASLMLPRLRAAQGARALIVRSAAVAVISYLLVGVSPWVALVVAASLGYGWFEGISIPILQDVIAAAGPTESRAGVVSVWVAIIRTGQTLGPLLASAMLSVSSERAVFIAGAGVVAALTLFAAVATLPAVARDAPQ